MQPCDDAHRVWIIKSDAAEEPSVLCYDENLVGARKVEIAIIPHRSPWGKRFP